MVASRVLDDDLLNRGESVCLLPAGVLGFRAFGKITTRGRVAELVEPELVTDSELRRAPRAVRFVERRIAGVTQYLRTHGA
jgi:hypothetical protein